MIHERHKLRDRRIALQGINIVGHLLDRLVHQSFCLLTINLTFYPFSLQCPNTIKETGAALDGVIIPGRRFFVVPDKDLIQSQSIRAVFFHDIIGIHHIAP